MQNLKDQILSSLKKLEKWVEDHDYKGYEPFDGLSSVFRPLTFGNLFLNRLLLQLVRQSPINLRPILGVKPLDSTIGRGYMAWGYCNMFKLTRDQRYKDKAVSCLEWLLHNKSPAYEEYSWGKHFDFASRGGIYYKFEPILVWTVLIGQAYLDAHEVFGEQRYLDIAISISNWIMGLPRNQTEYGLCLGYHYHDYDATIHNSNMLGAAFLARTGKLSINAEFIRLAGEAMKYSCAKQLPNGAWWYGEDSNLHWIDNFHTGYNLDALKCYIDNAGDNTYQENLRKGLEFYKNHFFEKTGRPRYYHKRTYPVDSQCASQAIDTLANFSVVDQTALDLAKKVALWTIKNMQDSQGFFYYRQYPMGIKAKAPMLLGAATG